MKTIIQHQLDTCGLVCPEPIMMLHNKIRSMQKGELVEVLATDPSTQRDIPKFCNFIQHDLIEQTYIYNTYRYVIRKS